MTSQKKQRAGTAEVIVEAVELAIVLGCAAAVYPAGGLEATSAVAGAGTTLVVLLRRTKRKR